MRAAQGRDELRSSVAVEPDEGNVVAGDRGVRVAACEITPRRFSGGVRFLGSLGIERRVGRERAVVGREQRIIVPREDANELVAALLPVERELEPLVEESVAVLRVERAAATVFGGAIEGPREFAIGRPDRHPPRMIVGLGHPDAALRINGEPTGVVHVQRLIGAGRRFSSLADHGQRLARRRKRFHLVRIAAVGDEDVSLGVDRHVPGIVEAG